jgi:uncharacterized protein YcfJ
MNERLPFERARIQWLQAMMTQRCARRITAEALGMNRNATAALALLLASAATFGIWQYGWNGPAYARVLSATPVSVREPRYADVLEARPAAGPGDRPVAWEVAYRQDGRVLHTLSRVEPGDQIRIGEQRRVIGYDVAWRWRERSGVVRLGQRPGKYLPVENGAVVETRRPLARSS